MTSEFGMAVHALTFLNHKGEIVSSEALAKNICTNPARVRKVMAKLKKAGLVDTKEGLEGGYLFQGCTEGRSFHGGGCAGDQIRFHLMEKRKSGYGLSGGIRNGGPAGRDL